MKRSTTLALGVCSFLLAGLAVGTGGVRAGEKDGDEERVERTVTKGIEVTGTWSGGGFLGVGLEDLEGAARGAKVQTVRPDSAAAKAGLEDGDVIVRFDGVDVRSARQLARLVRETPAGREVDIEVTRDGAARTLTATLARGLHLAPGGPWPHGLEVGPGQVVVPGIQDLDMEDFDIEGAPELPYGAGPHVFRWHGDDGHDFSMSLSPGRPRLGIDFIEMGDQLASFFGLTTGEGVLVTSVGPETPAAKAGVKAGDVVLEFDGTAIRDGAQLRRHVREAESGRAVTMKLQRDGKALDVEVTLPEPEKPKTIRYLPT
jgi:serine protease Do